MNKATLEKKEKNKDKEGYITRKCYLGIEFPMCSVCQLEYECKRVKPGVRE